MKKTIAQKVHDARSRNVIHTYRLVKTNRLPGDAKIHVDPDEVWLLNSVQFQRFLDYLEHDVDLPEPKTPDETARQEERRIIKMKQISRTKAYIEARITRSIEEKTNKVMVTELYFDYVKWVQGLENAPKQVMTRIIFRKILRECGIKIRKMNGQIYALGVVFST